MEYFEESSIKMEDCLFHGCVMRQIVVPQVFVVIGAHPLQRFGKLAGFAALGQQGGAELRLAAGAFEVEHHHAGNIKGHGQPKVFFQQGQRQVYAGRHASRGIDVAVLDVQSVLLHVDCGRKGPQAFNAAPMRGGAAAFKKPGARQDESTRADGANAPHQRGALAHRVHKRLRRLLRLRPASHQQRVGPAALRP